MLHTQLEDADRRGMNELCGQSQSGDESLPAFGQCTRTGSGRTQRPGSAHHQSRPGTRPHRAPPRAERGAGSRRDPSLTSPSPAARRCALDHIPAILQWEVLEFILSRRSGTACLNHRARCPPRIRPIGLITLIGPSGGWGSLNSIEAKCQVDQILRDDVLASKNRSLLCVQRRCRCRRIAVSILDTSASPVENAQRAA